MKVKNDRRSKFSNLSNWKEEAWKKKKFCSAVAGRFAYASIRERHTTHVYNSFGHGEPWHEKAR